MKATQVLQLVLVAAAAVAVYAFVSVARDGEMRRSCTPLCAMHPAYAGVDRTAPDFDLEDLGRGRLRLSQLRGKVVILNFWTETCRPCLEEMPSIADLARMIKGRDDVVLVTVTIDEGADAVRATLKGVLGEDPPFRVLLDPESKIVGGKYGTRLFPETWFIDPDGVIRARVDGARDWTSAMVLDLVGALLRPGACPIDVQGGVPTGPGARVCEETGPSG